MIAILETPVKLRIPTELVGKARSLLNYEDKKVTYEWLKWHKIQTQDDQWLSSNMKSRRHWFFNKNTRDSLDLKVRELYDSRFKSLLFQDDKGYWTYSGFVTLLFGKDVEIKREYELPEFKTLDWYNKPDFEPRYYQTDSLNLLVPLDQSRSHGAVSLATGAGKTYVIASILKRIGLQAVVVVPTLSIAEQMLKDMKNWFGVRNVGQFFDGKKESDKYFVIAVAKSLMNIKEGDEHDSNISNRKVVIFDESHMVPAASLATIAINLFENVPYRYFFSGTQIRTDGLELTLDGIIGDIVFSMTVEEGVDQGFLSKPLFFQWKIKSNSNVNVDDSIKMNRVHLHYNQNVNNHAVRLAKYAVSKGRRVVIMIDEVEQFKYLVKAGLLELNCRFAYGSLDKDQKKEVPVQFHKADNLKLVAEFDKGEYNVLVATQALGYGTDIKSASCIISLVGLTSEIGERQRVGRGTRLFPGKTDCVFNDYNIYNIPMLEKHAKKRLKIYNSIYGKCKEMEEK